SKAGEVEDAQRTTYQKQVLKLANALALYQQLKNSIQPEGTHDFADLIADYQASLPAGVAAARAQRIGEKFDEAALKKIADFAQVFEDVANFEYALTVPPSDPAKK